MDVGGDAKTVIVMKFNKLGRLRWAGHVMRMEESDPAMKDL